MKCNKCGKEIPNTQHHQPSREVVCFSCLDAPSGQENRLLAAARGSEASSVKDALDKEAWAIATSLAQIGNGWSWKDDLQELIQRACAWDSNVKKAVPPNTKLTDSRP